MDHGEQEQTVTTFKRRLGEEVRINAKLYRRKGHLNIRLWYTEDGEVWWPTKTGITFRAHELEDLAEAINQAREVIKDMQATQTPTNDLPGDDG